MTPQGRSGGTTLRAKTPGSYTKRISPNAYQALREALPVVFHYKRPYESYLRSALREHPELLGGLNFSDLKRRVADELVRRLVANESRYQQTALDLMLAVSSMERFPDLEKHEDAAVKLAEARASVTELRRWTAPFSHQLNEQQEAASRRESAEQQAAALRTLADDLLAIKDDFYALHASDHPQECGRRFERFLASLFELFDLEPRFSPTHSSPNRSTAR